MSTYEDLRIDAVAEMAEDRHQALHTDLDYVDPECGLCDRDEARAIEDAYADAGFTGRTEVALLERYQDGDR